MQLSKTIERLVVFYGKDNMTDSRRAAVVMMLLLLLVLLTLLVLLPLLLLLLSSHFTQSFAVALRLSILTCKRQEETTSSPYRSKFVSIIVYTLLSKLFRGDLNIPTQSISPVATLMSYHLTKEQQHS